MKTCEQCKRFRKHYVRVNDRLFMPIHTGHCVYPRIKTRKNEAPACAHFLERAPKETKAQSIKLVLTLTKQKKGDIFIP